MRIAQGDKVRRIGLRSAAARAWRAVLKMPATAFIALALSGGNAFAQQTGTDPSQMLKNITQFILGPFGQTLAVLGIVAIGLSWMFGRASLGLVAGVIGGIVIMFGASFMATTLTGGG